MHSHRLPELTGLVNHLYRDGLLNFTSAQLAIAQQDKSITQYLVENSLLSSETILNYCAKKFGLAIYDFKKNSDWDKSILKPELIFRLRIIPLYRDQNFLYLGITDPTNQAILTTVGFHTGLYIRPLLIAEGQLTEVLNTLNLSSPLNSQLETALAKIAPHEEQQDQEIIDQDDEPVIEFVNQIIQDAIESHASDIHIEPYQTDCRIRFRIDGLLYETTTIPSHLASRVNIRLKIMANLNIAEQRLPQDGRIPFSEMIKIDIRINICPTLFGEKIVLRLSDPKLNQLNIHALGMQPQQEKLFLKKLAQPQGLILVTGPTGSGKTITLYSALHFLNQIEKNISTVEDPVEIELKGINQVNINPKIGFHFATALRTLLRQDPDVIMIGEIRDSDTANIAIQAAQTGHLVLSTLHTNNALAAITRLKSMQVPIYYLYDSLLLIMAQRLLRRLCSICKQAEILPTQFFQNNQHKPFIAYRATGCEACHQGYLGRVGIFEFISTIKKSNEDIKPDENFVSLWEAGLEKVREGITSFAEVMRVVGHQDH